MTALPAIAGARNVTFLTGSELIGVGTHGSMVAQTTAADIAALGLAVGNAFFVNEATGSDTNNGSRAAPFMTLTAALAAATENHGDVIYLQGTIHVSATVAWNKAGVSLVGINPPSANDRARISQTGSVVFSPLVLVSASSCAFINIATFHGFDDASAQICWEDTAGRNYYAGCDFLGMGHATAAAQAGGRSFLLTGSNGECLFEGCRFGLDTITRATATNATLEIAGGSPRNIFNGCIFSALCSLATDVHVLVGSGGMDRWAIFNGCTFVECVDSTGSTLNAALSVNASAGGSVILNACISVGATAIATTGPVYVNQISAAGATTTYIGLHAT